MTEEKNQKKDFIIKDRRFSAQEGQTSDNGDKQNESASELKGRDPTPEKPEIQEDDVAGLPEINFMTFIMSLNASAMVHLGIIEDPVAGKTSKNLALGKQTIDILGMIEEKTRGNLSKDEENMLKNILYDLRIIYIKEKS